MSKKKARIILILLAASLVLLLYTAFIGWGPTGTGAMKNIKLGLDLEGGVSVTYQAKEDNPSAEDMADTVYKLQKRVDAISTEAHVYQEGSNRINIEIPGVSNAEEILSQLGKPGSLKFELSDGTEILDGSHIESAEAASTRDNMNNTKYVVEVTFDKKGAKAFGDATTKNVGKPISIVYDGETISSPVVQQAITDGKCEISGNFTLDSAKELASSIRIGSLSLELEEIRSQVVGAQLGQQALKTSLIGGIIGVICVMIIMIIAYKVPGIVASFALLLYTALDLVAMNAFDMTLTLPGIAGVILSIGMAVDANVIIYARIREEIAGGNSVRSAIDTGFRKEVESLPLSFGIRNFILFFYLSDQSLRDPERLWVLYQAFDMRGSRLFRVVGCVAVNVYLPRLLFHQVFPIQQRGIQEQGVCLPVNGRGTLHQARKATERPSRHAGVAFCFRQPFRLLYECQETLPVQRVHLPVFRLLLAGEERHPEGLQAVRMLFQDVLRLFLIGIKKSGGRDIVHAFLCQPLEGLVEFRQVTEAFHEQPAPLF